MSLHTAAQHLASKGRHGDSMLVHMTPDEVGGLQALAMAKGGSLTINPETGLVEAFSLKSLLPTLAGIGLSFIPGVGPIAAGMMTGAFETVRTGDLGKGILAGLGAYGGAGLGNALTSAGASSIGSTELAAQSLTPEVGSQAATLQAQNAVAQGLPTAIGTGPGSQAAMLAAENAALELTPVESIANLTSSGSSAYPSAVPSAMSQTANVAKQGLASLNTTEGLSKFGTALDQQFPSMTAKAAAAAPLVLAATEQKPYTPPKPEKSDYEGPYKPPKREVRFPTDRDPNDSSEFSFFTPSNPYPGYLPFTAASGGLMGYAQGGNRLDMDDGSFVMSAREVAEVGNGSSNAGLERLAKLGAQPIRGRGDGVSDSIRANIGGTQEARVARDEAYFPPEAVKRIGGGSPKKGAKKLYALMSAAEKARKKAPRGGDSGLHKLMPA